VLTSSIDTAVFAVKIMNNLTNIGKFLLTSCVEGKVFFNQTKSLPTVIHKAKHSLPELTAE